MLWFALWHISKHINMWSLASRSSFILAWSAFWALTWTCKMSTITYYGFPHPRLSLFLFVWSVGCSWSWSPILYCFPHQCPHLQARKKMLFSRSVGPVPEELIVFCVCVFVIIFMSHLFLTCRVIATILQALQTFDKDLKDLTASARHVIIQIRKDAFREKKKVCFSLWTMQ